MTTAPADLSDRFFRMWVDMCDRLRVDPFDLIRVSYSEAGCRAGAHNPHGDASGLLQFMPATLSGLGWTKGHEAFRLLSADEQIPFVDRYMRPHASWTTSDALCYVAVFLPALGAHAQAQGPDFVLCGQRGPLAWAYVANRVLDRDGNGAITVADLGKQLEAQCRGARWDAILWRLRQAMGLQPPAVAEPPPTQPEVYIPPVVNTDIMETLPDNEATQPTMLPSAIIHPVPDTVAEAQRRDTDYLGNAEPDPDPEAA